MKSINVLQNLQNHKSINYPWKYRNCSTSRIIIIVWNFGCKHKKLNILITSNMSDCNILFVVLYCGKYSLDLNIPKSPTCLLEFRTLGRHSWTINFRSSVSKCRCSSYSALPVTKWWESGRGERRRPLERRVPRAYGKGNIEMWIAALF